MRNESIAHDIPESSLITERICNTLASINRILSSVKALLNGSLIKGMPSLSQITGKLIGDPRWEQLNVADFPTSTSNLCGSICTEMAEMTTNFIITFSSPSELLATQTHLPALPPETWLIIRVPSYCWKFVPITIDDKTALSSSLYHLKWR